MNSETPSPMTSRTLLRVASVALMVIGAIWLLIVGGNNHNPDIEDYAAPLALVALGFLGTLAMYLRESSTR